MGRISKGPEAFPARSPTDVASVPMTPLDFVSRLLAQVPQPEGLVVRVVPNSPASDPSAIIYQQIERLGRLYHRYSQQRFRHDVSMEDALALRALVDELENLLENLRRQTSEQT